jgi:hypothetical protein
MFAAFVLQNEANCCLCPFGRDLPFHIDSGDVNDLLFGPGYAIRMMDDD